MVSARVRTWITCDYWPISRCGQVRSRCERSYGGAEPCRFIASSILMRIASGVYTQQSKRTWVLGCVHIEGRRMLRLGCVLRGSKSEYVHVYPVGKFWKIMLSKQDRFRNFVFCVNVAEQQSRQIQKKCASHPNPGNVGWVSSWGNSYKKKYQNCDCKPIKIPLRDRLKRYTSQLSESMKWGNCRKSGETTEFRREMFTRCR